MVDRDIDRHVVDWHRVDHLLSAIGNSSQFKFITDWHMVDCLI